jgi:FtsZ-binding cell division protein ZapB
MLFTSAVLAVAASAIGTAAPAALEDYELDPVMPSVTTLLALECAELEGECDTLSEQVAQAPARRDAMQRRDALQAQLDAAQRNSERTDALTQSLAAVNLESAQLPLSEEDYLTLTARHAALVQKVEAKIIWLAENRHSDLLTTLAAKLTALKALDLNVLLDPGHMDPVCVEDTDPVHVFPVSDESTSSVPVDFVPDSKKGKGKQDMSECPVQ